MPEAGTRRVIAVASALALLSATLALLFCTEPISVRFWFAVAVTAGIVSFVTLLSRRLLFASVIVSSLVAVLFLVSLEKQATMHMGTAIFSWTRSSASRTNRSSSISVAAIISRARHAI